MVVFANHVHFLIFRLLVVIKCYTLSDHKLLPLFQASETGTSGGKSQHFRYIVHFANPFWVAYALYNEEP